MSEQADIEKEEIDRKCGHYFVPEKVAAIVHAVEAEFDIDPCAHPQQIIRAREKFVGSTLLGVDGFPQPWAGSCWLNPPSLARKPVKKLPDKTSIPIEPNYPFYPLLTWIRKGLELYETGNLHTLMVYSPTRTGASWFNRLRRESLASLDFDGRIHCYISQKNSDGQFLDPKMMKSPMSGASVFLFTRDDEKRRLRSFIEAASSQGVVMQAARL